MKELISRIQKNVSQIQRTIHKEGGEIIKTMKKFAEEKNLKQRRKEIEKIVGTKLKTLEPAFDRFVIELGKSAKKHGIDLTSLEKKAQTGYRHLKKSLQEKATQGKTRKKSAAPKTIKTKKSAPKRTKAKSK